MDCLVPNCVYLQNDEIRWPTRVREEFYRCVFLLDTLWLPFLDRCPQGTYFSFYHQDCIDPAGWTDVCAAVPEDITTTQMTTTTEIDDGGEVESPLPVICGSPRCSTAVERSLLWPSTVANQFYECLWVERLFQFVPFPRRCPNFLLFDFQKQECVHSLQWVDICPIYPTLPPSCPDCCPTCPPATDAPTEAPTTAPTEVPTEAPTTEVSPTAPSDDPAYPEWMPIPIICGMPRCNNELEQAFLWPADSPKNFYVCVDTGTGWMQATLSECNAGKYFQTMLQACVPEEEYDWDFCPIFPTPPPASTVTPEASICMTDFNPMDLAPVVCDMPRCITAIDLTTFWPSIEKSFYYKCEPLDTTFVHVLVQCDIGQQFDFFRQCCTTEEPSEEVCPVFPVLPTMAPTLPIQSCLDNYNPTNVLPATCDIPRCKTSFEVAAFWPSAQPSKYYECELQFFGDYAPAIKDCPPNAEFDFFRQCCTSKSVLAANEVCALMDETLPTVPPNSQDLCDQPFCDTDEHRNFLWASADPSAFYRCEAASDGSYQPNILFCPQGEYFLVQLQTCGNATLHQGTCGETEEAQPPAPTPEPILTPPPLG